MNPLRLLFWLLCAGCGAAVQVPTGPGTAYPCGVDEVVCVTQRGCCDPDNTCGGEPLSMPGCPAGMCCAIPSSDPVGPAERKTRPPTPQRPWSADSS